MGKKCSYSPSSDFNVSRNEQTNGGSENLDNGLWRDDGRRSDVVNGFYIIFLVKQKSYFFYRK